MTSSVRRTGRDTRLSRRQMLGAIAATGLVPQAQAQAPARIAYLSGRSLASDGHLLQAFLTGLKSAGYVDGQNVTVDVRWADGKYDQVPALAAAVVASNPNVLVAVGGNPVGLAAKAATSTIPIVFGAGADPVLIGLVKNLNRPDGNATGMTLWANELDVKRLDLLHDMLPAARTVALLINPTNPGTAEILQRTREAAATLGLKVEVLNATSSAEIEKTFEALPPGRVDGLAVGADAFLINQRARIVALTAARGLPAIFPAREFAMDGGLASYGARWSEMYEIVGAYAGRILKGAKVGDLPVQRPTTYELVVNMKTVKALGLTLPPTLLARADEVIE